MDSVENHSSSDVCPRLSFARDLMPLSILLVLFAGPTSDDLVDFGRCASLPISVRCNAQCDEFLYEKDNSLY